jgi:serine/threonine protein phosphatase PrpC
VEAGGRIKRITDAEGNRVGPYRVWESHLNSPGLTLSRSIGDNIAKSIGVISTPDISHCLIDDQNDLFVIIGSDGIWDAMTNEDAVRYVEFFREKSCRSLKKTKETPNLSNTCIAQLLCEEARVRWLAIVQEDDVSIDDISCLILEISQSETSINLPKVQNIRRQSFLGSSSDLFDLKKEEKITIEAKILKDPKRGSQVTIEGNLPVYSLK